MLSVLSFSLLVNTSRFPTLHSMSRRQTQTSAGHGVAPSQHKTGRWAPLSAAVGTPLTRAFGTTLQAVALWIRKTDSYPETMPQQQVSLPRTIAMTAMPMPTGRRMKAVNCLQFPRYVTFNSRPSLSNLTLPLLSSNTMVIA